jgi:serine protease Do
MSKASCSLPVQAGSNAGWRGTLRSGARRKTWRIAQIFCWAAWLLVMAAFLPGNSRAQGSNDELHKLNDSVNALVKKVSPSVVQILVTAYGPLEENAHSNSNTNAVIGKQRAIGSGFVIDPNGYIVTNAHVVNGAQRVQVVLPMDGEGTSLEAALSPQKHIVPARIVGVAKDIDLAVIKIDGANLPALPLGSYRKVNQGELVFAFGSPEGLRNTVTMGVVSAVARQTDPDSPLVYIQTDAPINPGNSGGPLVNVNGEVVGVDTFILSESGGNEGLGFAIPSGVVSVAYQQLRKFGHIHRAEIGIGIQTITPNMAAALNLPRKYGVVISDVQPDSAAEGVGLLPGDVLLAVDGKPADNLPLVAFHFLSVEQGDKVHLDILRGKDLLSFDVKANIPPHDMDQVNALADPEKGLVPALGILGVEIDKKIAAMLPELRDPFGIIVAARATGTGAEVPLTTGDVIRALNGQPMTTLDRLRSTLKALPPGAPVALQIQRETKLMYLVFTVEQ